MMMEEADDNDMVEENLDDNSTNPPSFAIKPETSEEEDDDDDEEEGSDNGENKSAGDAENMTPSPSDTSDTPAPIASSDPFDLLSMTTPSPATAEAPAEASTTQDFDAFAAPISEGDTNSSSATNTNATQDFLGTGTTVDDTGTGRQKENPRELHPAESGDLLHLTDPTYDPTAQNQTGPSDFMDPSFQTLPVTVAPTNEQDPFETPVANNPADWTSQQQSDSIQTKTASSGSSSGDQINKQDAPNAEQNPQPSSGSSETPASSPDKDLNLNNEDNMEDESSMFEEVELASPSPDWGAREGGNRGKSVAAHADDEAKVNLKPPSLTDTDNAPVSTNSEKSAAPKEDQTKRIQELEAELAKAQELLTSSKQEAEEKGKQHKEKDAETTTILQELQTKLQNEQTQRAEAENQLKLAKEENQKLLVSMSEQQDQWHNAIEESRNQLHAVEKENEDLIAKAKEEKEERQEHERRERVLANKLNNLKKQQANKTDVEEVYEDDMRLLKEEAASKAKQVEELEAAQNSLKEELEQLKVTSQTRIDTLEKAVREEKQLNEERKKKMKAFVEAKSEELKEAQAQAEQYQNELNQNNQGMVDLNQRWKTLHAQWVQSQTRNRELQRDLNKVKKDYENLNKVGDSVNAKLSRSSNEVEQHKNKRLAAKQELMSVLGKLDSEREISNKLRDSVRFTFTPKAQSQHQLLKENLEEFQKQLQTLARRLGRPIPLSSNQESQSLASMVMSSVEESEASEREDDLTPTNGGGEDSNQNGGSGASKEQHKVLLETTRLLAKLEVETQRISQGIMALSSGIEQMNQLVTGGGERTCFTSLGDIFFGGGVAKALESGQTNSGGNASRARGGVKSGHVSHFPTEGSGQMT
mgnify:CR=1 FL=1